MTDCQVLGIPETADAGAVKEAYRKRVKELHPDSSPDGETVRNHFLFIEVCNAYRRLSARLSARVAGGDRTGAIGGDPAGGRASGGKDPGYEFYKKGMDLFMRIHPSAWTDSPISLKPPRSAGDDDARSRERLASVTRLFPKAYYCFSVVVSEFPESPWAADARRKMDEIEERSKRYRRILESFARQDGTPRQCKESK